MLMKAVERQHKDCVALLLEYSASPDLRGPGGNTTLHLAAVIPSKSLVELLLEHNDHIDPQNELGYTPLGVAITEHCEEMVEFLLQKGPDVHAQDKHESIPNQLEEYVGCEKTGECSAGGTVGLAVLHSPCSGTNADFPLGTPALTRTGVLPAAGAEQEEDFDSPSESKVSGLEREELQLKKDASTQSDCRGDRQRWVRQLQQELANALKKSSLAEASLEAKKRYSRDLQEQKLQLQEELGRSKVKLQELKEQHVRTECYAKSLKNAIKDKERELTASRILQGLLAASSGTAAVSELEKRMQRLQVGKARLEAIAQQQAKTIEALQKDLQASASIHNGLEDLITGFQTTQTAQEHQHQQCGSESKEAKKLAKMKCRLEALLDEMRGRNIALEEERTRLKILLEGSWTTLMAYARRESQLTFQGDVKNSCSEVANQVGKLRRKPQLNLEYGQR